MPDPIPFTTPNWCAHPDAGSTDPRKLSGSNGQACFWVSTTEPPLPLRDAPAPPGVGEGSLGDREALSDSLEHIFSHVRHTMHVEHAASPPPTAGEVKEEGEGAAEPWTSNGRTYCWMGEQRMREVGITAGVLKVIAAVESATGRTSANKSAGKRKSTASVDTTQPKMSKFFSRKERDA